ncbi:MAG: alpha/beta hydrolase [Leptospiraceae bacterium]|nr:alpha/beta hydrolase [Leptospiraceae bacterium]MCK6380981.1 alpha/beta hydrolase [Leptospiraceae bacterium]NUM40266.1 alpha/beta hydrolase [Leptospiraceae bacterium]
MKIIKRTLIAALILFSFALFGGAWYFSSVLMYTKVSSCKPEHYVFCNDPKIDLGLDFENIELHTKDGFTLSAWYIPSKQKSSKAVISIHGRGATRREGLRFVKAIHELGINVIMPDLRNCGESQKSFSSMSYHERKDVESAYNYLKEVKKMNSIGILGFSMGAATSIIFMAEHPDIKVGIFDSGFSDFYDVITINAKNDYGLPKYPLLPIVSLLYELRGNLNLNEMSPKAYIGKISPRPVLILHGTADVTVPYSMGQELYENAKNPKELITIKDGRHTRLWQKDPDLIKKKVQEYYGKYL